MVFCEISIAFALARSDNQFLHKCCFGNWDKVIFGGEFGHESPPHNQE
jgi:hypothetical protein